MKHLLPIALLLLASSAAAQVPSAAFEILATSEPFLEPDATTEIPVTVTVGCLEVLENMGEADVSISIVEPPAWLTYEALEMHFGIEDCAGHEEITKDGNLIVDVFGAPGLEAFSLTVQAALGSHTTDAVLEDLMVDYLPGHTMDPDGDQTFQVMGATYEFDLTVDILANAKTMIMFEDKVVSGTASLTGLKANIFDVAAGDTQMIAPVLFTAPEGPWTQETVTFYTYTHCLDKEGCGPQQPQNITWTFVNANPAPLSVEETSESTPSVPIGMLLVAVAGLAVAVRRTS